MDTTFHFLLVLIVVGIASYGWRNRRRRPREAGFPFVYINQNGTARELTAEERAYLETDFAGGDGGRPYIKSNYKSKDGWGSISGFIERVKVPAHVRIEAPDPAFGNKGAEELEDPIEAALAIGDRVTANPDGSVTIAPDPDLSDAERFRLHQEHQLLKQREREARAKLKEPPGGADSP